MSRPVVDADQTAKVTLSGDLARPARLSVPDLLAWPQHRVRVSFDCATSGVQHHRFAGPLLHDVLGDAGPGFDPARRKDRLRFLVALTGADGHHVLLSWAEIDPDFGAAPVLLATTIDDTPLDRADLSSSCPRTGAAPGTSAGSTRSAWTAVTARGRDLPENVRGTPSGLLARSVGYVLTPTGRTVPVRRRLRGFPRPTA